MTLNNKDLVGEYEELNSIEVADFRIMSSNASLEEVEACMDRLISKHKDFADNRTKLRVIRHNTGL